MIVGIGNDIIEIERIEKAISKEGFKNKIYTQRELKNIENAIIYNNIHEGIHLGHVMAQRKILLG